MRDDVFLNEPWLKWAIEIQSIAQNGLTYCKDIFDKERYERLREISAEMISTKTEIPKDKVKVLFRNEKGYQTPKIDTRAVIFKDYKILLVRENNGKWSLPGGWCDVLESIGSNTVKEVREEAGIDAEPVSIIAVQDRNKHNTPPYAYGVCKIFVLCNAVGGAFKQKSETTEARYFPIDNIPELAQEKCNIEQIQMCFEASKSDNWKTMFD